MDPELKAYLDERFRENRAEMLGLRGEMNDLRGEVGSLRDESHQTRIVVEDLRGQVRLLAEGVMGVTEKLEEHRTEVRLGFENVKASIVPYYQNLDERIGLLEARADRQTRDVLDVIREKYGKR